MKDNNSYERYQRQTILKELGEAGQQKLLEAKVLVIGAGGLGCPVLQYLAAAGTGMIGIVDDDVVALSNLHRQVLYSVNDIGFSKAERAAKVLNQLNPAIHIITYKERLTTKNALQVMEGYDIIVDGTDNFPTRYMINDACVILGKTLVFGAVSRFEGQLAVFNAGKDDEDRVNYRDLFPQPPANDEILNCAEAGVLGVLPGIIGTMMANETIKLITGIGKPLVNRLLTYNALTNQLYDLTLQSSKESASLIPKDEAAFLQTDYEWLCGPSLPQQLAALEIDPGMFDSLLHKENIDLVDVREPGEKPEINEFPHIKIPLSQLKENSTMIRSDIVIVFCQSGKRSLQAAAVLAGIYGATKKIYSLPGGIIQWKQQHSKQPV